MMFVVVCCLALLLVCLVLCGPSCWWHLLLVVLSVRVPESGVCVHSSGEDWVWYVCDVLYAVLYLSVNCFVVFEEEEEVSFIETHDSYEKLWQNIAYTIIVHTV